MGAQEFDVLASSIFVPIRGVMNKVPLYGMFQDGDGNIGFAINGQEVFVINSSGGGSSGVVGHGDAGDLAVYPADGNGVQGQPLTDILDDLFGSTQGGVLFRGASGWSFLGAGLDGRVLTTHGPGADPTWEVGGGGGGTPWILPFHSVTGVTATYAMTADDYEVYVANTDTTAVTVRLPASPTPGQHARVTDGANSANLHHITITDSSGSTTVFIIDVERETVLLRWTGTIWGVVS